MRELDVVFGSGLLGRAVARELLAHKKRVPIVSRSGNGALVGAENHAADATDPKAVAKACEGARVVFHTATPDYTRWAELYPPIQRGILEGCASAGVKLVSAESVYMYGPGDRGMTESSPHVATT